MITDESRLLVLNFSEAMEPEAIKAAEEAFQSQKESAESEMKKTLACRGLLSRRGPEHL